MQERQDSLYLRRTRPDKRKEASRKTIPPDGTIRELTGAASVMVNERGGKSKGFWTLGNPMRQRALGATERGKKNLGGFSGSQRKDCLGDPKEGKAPPVRGDVGLLRPPPDRKIRQNIEYCRIWMLVFFCIFGNFWFLNYWFGWCIDMNQGGELYHITT